MSKRRRLIELGKDALILLLAASAVYLLTMTPLIRDSGVLDLLRPRQEDPQGSSAVTLTAAARPSRMAATFSGGRYGLQYDQAAVDELFARLGPLLGEALTSAGEPSALNESQWRRDLGALSLYFDFSGQIPLSALGTWLNQEGDCALSGSARRILLCAGGGDGVLLCWEDSESGHFFSCPTGLTASLHLEPAVQDLSGNGAQFAFESSAYDGLLDPYTFITDEQNSQIYTAANPLSGSESLTALLNTLDYNGRNHASVSGGERYLDGNDRLLIRSSGTVTFSAAEPGKYPVPSAGESPTVAEAIEAARGLTESTVGAFCGSAQLYLSMARAAEDGWLIRFGYRLNGSTVWLYEDGWAAEVRIRSGCITEFTLHFRSYAPSGEEALLLPMNRAAVMLPGLGQEGRELVIRYQDAGESAVRPVWVAQ